MRLSCSEPSFVPRGVAEGSELFGRNPSSGQMRNPLRVASSNEKAPEGAIAGATPCGLLYEVFKPCVSLFLWLATWQQLPDSLLTNAEFLDSLRHEVGFSVCL